ncbi:MAG: zinc ABC transporter substrate-binding protein [bacterium]|nr:zinc ABC transporter substrate-binding protein [bacterium]
MKKSIVFLVGVVIIFGLLLYGISYRFQQQNQPVFPNARIQVVASFYPLAHMAEQVGKERVDVLNLTPAGSEPHDADPSPRDVATLQNAQMFLYNGAGLEPWVSHLLPELTQKGVRIVEATKDVPLLAGDPHVWLDPLLVKEQVNTIASVFASVDAQHATEYRENARIYTQELEALHQEFTKGLATCVRRDIVTSHAAFAYMVKRYELNMIPIAGLSPEEEPTPARLAEISNLVEDSGVTHIFFETLVSPRLAETIANETGAQVLALNPLEGLSDEEIATGKTYISVQRENLHALKIALGCI